MIGDRTPVFKDFAPVIEGQFNVIATFRNKTADEFFVYKEQIDTTLRTVPTLVGYDLQSLDSANFLPFSIGGQKVIMDPRSIFGPRDVLKGIVCSEKRPTIRMVDAERAEIEVGNIVPQDGRFLFSLPMKEVKSGNYVLTIGVENQETITKVISILTFDVKRPKEFEWSDPPDSGYNYYFLLGQQFLNKGDAEGALRNFRHLPPELWNSVSLPIIGQAYYMKGDYEKVLELLGSEKVEKLHPVLTLLARSCLALGRWRPAADYFEKLRRYGDTAEINRNLAKIYERLGDKEKAAAYAERAQALEKKSSGARS
jgi:hypothetical protein